MIKIKTKLKPSKRQFGNNTIGVMLTIVDINVDEHSKFQGTPSPVACRRPTAWASNNFHNIGSANEKPCNGPLALHLTFWGIYKLVICAGRVKKMGHIYEVRTVL